MRCGNGNCEEYNSHGGRCLGGCARAASSEREARLDRIVRLEASEMHDDTKAEILESCPSMGEVVNKAAKHLPDGWEVRICIEKYAGTVELVDPDGNVTNIEGGNDSGIVGEVNDAICIANGFSI